MWDRGKSTLILLIMIFLFTYSSLSGVEGEEHFQSKLTEAGFRDGNISILQIEDQGTPILITNDIDFETQASLNKWEGDGSKETPYIINNLIIVTSLPTTNAIEIRNTNIHFIILNSTLTAFDGTGIRLSKVSNGIILNNTLLNNGEYGLRWSDSMIPTQSYYNSLINNTVYNSTRGGIVVQGNNSTLINNIVNGTGIGTSAFEIGGVNNTVLSNSAIDSGGTGFDLFQSHNNTLINNTVDNGRFYGFHLYQSQNNNVINNTVTDSGNGYDFYETHNSKIMGNTIQNSDHGFIISSTINSQFYNNTAIGSNVFGFSLFDSSDFNDFRYNLAQNNSKGGLRITSRIPISGSRGPKNNTIIQNNFENNGESGILITNSTYNRISYNTIKNNSLYGIHVGLTSGFNQIHHNKFISNNNAEIQAFCDNSTNEFDMNYWDDHNSPDLNDDGYIDEPYLIDGIGNCKDNKPTLTGYHISIPDKPLKLIAVAGIGKITLNWNAPTDDGGSPITGYRIYRSKVSGQGFNLLQETSETSFINTQVEIDQRYYYKISAINDVGEGSTTNEVNAIPLTPPTSVEPTTTSTETTMTSHSTTESPNDTNSRLNSGFQFISIILGLSIIQTIMRKVLIIRISL